MNQIARLLGALLFLFAGLAVAEETRGSATEAQAMVAKAITAYDGQGKAVFTAIDPPSTEFRDRDLYVFVSGSDGRIVAHGFEPKLIGIDLATLVDSAGKPFGREIVDKATEAGVWIDYAWLDPISGKDVPKSSWVVRHDGYVFGCGIYKP